MIVAYISLAVSIYVGVWSIRKDWSRKEFEKETKKELKRHSDILRNSKP